MNPLTSVEEGDRQFQRGEYGEAERLYRQALAEAERRGEPTNYIYTCLYRVLKRNGALDEAYEISRKAVPTPAAFTDCAGCLRAIARNSRDSGDDEGLRSALARLYSLGVLAFVCYPGNDCRGSVLGYQYERAQAICDALAPELLPFEYTTHGRIGHSGGLLGKRDYSMLAKTYGPNDDVFDPASEFAPLLERVGAALRRQNPDLWAWLDEQGLQ